MPPATLRCVDAGPRPTNAEMAQLVAMLEERGLVEVYLDELGGGGVPAHRSPRAATPASAAMPSPSVHHPRPSGRMVHDLSPALLHIGAFLWMSPTTSRLAGPIRPARGGYPAG
jgi:hypothetical protein